MMTVDPNGMILSTPDRTITTIPAKSHFTRNFLITLLTVFILLPLLAAMIIGFAKAADAPKATQGTADYNDGWVDMGQAMLDASKAPHGQAKVDHCLATAPNGDALITCIDAITLH